MHRFGSFRARALAFTAVIALVAIASISTSVAPSATEPSTRALSFAKIDEGLALQTMTSLIENGVHMQATAAKAA